MIRGIIFDLDGVLIDSEGLHFKAYRQVLKKLGVEISREEYERYWIALGTGPDYAVEKYHLPMTGDDLRRLKYPLFHRILKEEVILMPHVEEVLSRLKPQFRLALATNSNRVDVDFIMDRFGWDRFFSATVAREDYRPAKPEPDAFLEAAGRLRIDASECVVIEDTYKGVVAAARAGMPCIAVPNQYTVTNDFSLATVVLRGLRELTPALIESLPENRSARR